MPTPQITLTGNFQDLFSTADVGGQIIVTLENYGANIPRVSGAGILDKPQVTITADGNGNIPINTKIWGNDVITPSGTYYVVTLLSSLGVLVQSQAYVWNGTLTVDLGSAAPLNPIPPPTIPQLFIVVPFSATPVFNAGLGYPFQVTFQITLTGNVTSSTLTNAGIGQTIGFEIVQDGTGSRTFSWPTNVANPSTVDPGAGVTTAQWFNMNNANRAIPMGPATID